MSEFIGVDGHVINLDLVVEATRMDDGWYLRSLAPRDIPIRQEHHGADIPVWWDLSPELVLALDARLLSPAEAEKLKVEIQAYIDEGGP